MRSHSDDHALFQVRSFESYHSAWTGQPILDVFERIGVTPAVLPDLVMQFKEITTAANDPAREKNEIYINGANSRLIECTHFLFTCVG